MQKAVDTILAMSIPPAVMASLLAAFLIELACFFSTSRRGLWTPARLMASAIVPYLLFSIPSGQFRVESLALLAVLCGGAVWWLAVWKHPVAEFVYLAFIGAAYIGGWHKRVYTSPVEGLELSALGQLLWFRLALNAFLLHRDTSHLSFGFLPRAADWRTGAAAYALSMPVLALAAYLIGAGQFRAVNGIAWKAPLLFLGLLLVVSVFEEFLFRGVVLERLKKLWGVPAALVISSLAFGAVHLWYAHKFPNWKVVALASVAGLFYGGVYLRTASIRAAMVTHALVATTWKTLLE